MTHPVSLTAPQFASSPELVLDLARSLGPLNLTGMFVFDHLVPLGDPRRPVLEGASTLGAIAATATARVGSLVTRVTLREPAITAGIAIALAAIAPGRSVLGLGAGDKMSEDEAVRYGMNRPALNDRIALLEETIALVRGSAPNLPIWVGGRHPKVRAVAAARADGWNAWGASPDELRQEGEALRAEAARDVKVTWGGGVVLAPDQSTLDSAVAARGGLEAIARSGLTAGTPGRIVEHLAALAATADELVVSVLPSNRENWLLFSRSVLSHL
ncbi:MAG TPA: LLM class flavin-dependent oxidoreductase [Acidimicrobiia bacterium]|nr:LLM class flavin-dependent oxidoreductase [Acidimicrobiia bacterium]